MAMLRAEPMKSSDMASRIYRDIRSSTRKQRRSRCARAWYVSRREKGASPFRARLSVHRVRALAMLRLVWFAFASPYPSALLRLLPAIGSNHPTTARSMSGCARPTTPQ